MIPSVAATHPVLAHVIDRSLSRADATPIVGTTNAWSGVANRDQEIYARVAEALHEATANDGTLISPETFGRTLELLNSLPDNMPLPVVVVESENEIGLDWDEERRRIVSLTIRDTPMVGFAALFGGEPMHGRTPFVGELPEILRFLLGRLFPRRDRNTRANL